MNKVKFLALACFFTFAISCSQQKKYISYKVKQGESLRDIAKRLDIRTKDLLNLNPDVDKKPRANTTIIIPNPNRENTVITKEVKRVDAELTNAEEVLDSTMLSKTDKNESIVASDSLKIMKVRFEYLTHEVKAKETIYSITKKYDLSKDDLLKLNPEFDHLIDNKLSIGQVLKVKSKEIKTFISLEEDLKNHVIHVVKPKETVYGLIRFYNISKESLIGLNPEYPEINDDYLKIGQILRIRAIEEKSDTDDIGFYQDTIMPDASIKLALLMPFKAKEYDTIIAKDIFKRNKLTNMVTDFYMGAEIAIDSIKKQGVNVDVLVLDSGKKGKNIDVILKGGQLDDTDVIIGPFYSNKVDMVANKVKSPVVFPHFSNNQNKFVSSKIIKAEADLDSHSIFLASHLKDVYNGETIFIVGDGKAKSNAQISKLSFSLKQHDSIKKIIVLKPEDGYIKKERFTDHMKPQAHCWVIMTSNNNAVVADALNSMIVLPEEVTAQVFSIKKNKAYTTIDNNKLARVELVYVTNNYMDASDPGMKVFNSKYKSINYVLPSEYALKGFDVTYDILLRLASGDTLKETFKKGVSFRLGSKFEYENKAFTPSNNNGLFIVKYNKDLSLSRIK